jgi:hypothetical protein
MKKKLLPHLIALAIFLLIPTVYFAPLYEGKTIYQGDIHNFNGASKEISDFRQKTGEEALWTNSMFSGMPAYQISVVYKTNLIQYVQRVIMIGKTPASYLFLALLGFYVLLLAFDLTVWLSIIGAIAFSFSSYFFVILAAGHNSKFIAMTYMAPVIAGLFLAYRKNLWTGSAIFGLFMALEVFANHLQITYYLLYALLFFILYECYNAVKEKQFMQFLKKSLVLLAIALVAVGSDFSRLYTTWEYSKYSTRGKSDLTSAKENKTSGLDKDYITAWSYGKMETFTLMIPNFMGSSNVPLDETSNTYKALKQFNVPNAGRQARSFTGYLYWGDQGWTSAVYFGAIVVFLFFLALFVVKGPIKWWLVTVTVFSILLAWGKHAPLVTNFFIDHVPGYNKFRTVTMILVLAQLAVPLLGFIAVRDILAGKVGRKEFDKSLLYSLGIVGGLCLFFTLLPALILSFNSPIDSQLLQNGMPQELVNALQMDRKALLQSDAFRSLAFVLITATILFLFQRKKINETIFYASLAVFLFFDMWVVNKRFLNNDNFITRSQAKQIFQPTAADQAILQDKDLYYRVLNTTTDIDKDASISYFHKSISGYHGAKLKRYQELIERQLSKGNMQAFNMLNARYFIVKGTDGQLQAQYNPAALGNAWFVDSVMFVQNADEEIDALGHFNPQTKAIVDKRFENLVRDYSSASDTGSSIRLTGYQPNKLSYEYQASAPRLTVFSDIYYDKGWDAYIDGKPAPYFRADYVLRAMIVPGGKHTIEYRFEPKSFYTGNKVSLACSSLLVLFILGIAGRVAMLEFRKEKED